jgi:hypothetical protein
VIGGVFGDHTSMAGHMIPVRIAAVLLLCAAALSACHKDESTNSANMAPVLPKAPVVARKGPTAAELTAGMVEAAAQGKSQVPVALKFELVKRPKVGQPVDINLALISQVDASPVTIKVSGTDGVTVAAANEFDTPTAAAGEVYRYTVNVTPTAEGVLTVGVTVSMKRDEVTDVKVFSVPLIADR